MLKRSSGVLLHISSLPSAYGIGDLGPQAYKFADFLFASGQSYWQILPLNPTSRINGNSPYSSNSAFAFNPILVSPELLAEQGFLTFADLKDCPGFSPAESAYDDVYDFKAELFKKAFRNFKQTADKQDYENFCQAQKNWLEDFSCFCCFKRHFDEQVWSAWPRGIRDREPEALGRLKQELYEEIECEKFVQYIFFKQWLNLKNYCREKDIKIIGDVPIYVTYDSVDVWTHREIFKLDSEGKLSCVAGVPPDYFSATGQLWGNPLYNWDFLKESGYAWWIERFKHNFGLFDLVRIDHFRGFVDYWEVPSFEKTAINGYWQKAPAVDFFSTLTEKFNDFPIIAEDLGIITDEVRQVMKDFNFPGMKILMFAFGEDLEKHPYLPHNYSENCVAYTGTHDNNTVRGWYENDINDQERAKIFSYLKKEVPSQDLHWAFIELLMNSAALLVIFPLQDILGLDGGNRMNRPGKASGNWSWRMDLSLLTSEIVNRLKSLVSGSKR